MHIVENCHCGAEIVLDEPTQTHVTEQVRLLFSEWRTQHNHSKMEETVPAGPVPF